VLNSLPADFQLEGLRVLVTFQVEERLSTRPSVECSYFEDDASTPRKCLVVESIGRFEPPYPVSDQLAMLQSRVTDLLAEIEIEGKVEVVDVHLRIGGVDYDEARTLYSLLRGIPDDPSDYLFSMLTQFRDPESSGQIINVWPRQ
jgi:hypothetical protein